MTTHSLRLSFGSREASSGRKEDERSQEGQRSLLQQLSGRRLDRAGSRKAKERQESCIAVFGDEETKPTGKRGQTEDACLRLHSRFGPMMEKLCPNHTQPARSKLVSFKYMFCF